MRPQIKNLYKIDHTKSLNSDSKYNFEIFKNQTQKDPSTMTGPTEVTGQSSVNDTDILRTVLVNIAYSEANMLQVSLSQCIVLFCSGPSVHWQSPTPCSC